MIGRYTVIAVLTAVLLAGCTLADDGSPSTGDARLTAFTTVNATCGTMEPSQPSIESEATGDGFQFTVTGVVATSNPCHTLVGALESEDDGYALHITSNSESGNCVQCIGNIAYTATVTASGSETTLNVYHDGQRVAGASAAQDTAVAEAR